MKRVIQKRSDDCGVCCIAMVLNISYDEALEISKPYMEENNYSINFNKLEDCLIENGCTIKSSEGMPSKKSKNGILEITFNEVFHYVVWDSKGKTIIDPQTNIVENFISLRFIEILMVSLYK